MRETFMAKTNDDRVTVNDGTFTESKKPDGWADALIIAQVCNLSVTLIFLNLL
jgi:hypothetical protein